MARRHVEHPGFPRHLLPCGIVIPQTLCPRVRIQSHSCRTWVTRKMKVNTHSLVGDKLMYVASLQYKIEMLKDRMALKKMERKLDRKYQKLLNKKSLPKQPTLQVPESPTKGAPPLLPPTLPKLLTFLARKTRGGPYVPTKSSPRHRSR